MQYRSILATTNGGPEALHIVTNPVPEPGEGEVLLRMLCAGVSFADVMWVSGRVPGGPKVPFTPGYDMVGTIEESGPNVEGHALHTVAAALLTQGGYAEYAVVPQERLVPVPPEVDPIQAVCLIVNYLTAYQIYHRIAGIGNTPGSRVLIHGAGGGVGTALLELGRLLDFKTYGTASTHKQEIVTKLGGIWIDYQSEHFAEELRSHAREGFDLVIDPIGGPHLRQSLAVVRRGGMLVATASMASVLEGLSLPKTIFYYLSTILRNYLPTHKSSSFFDLPALSDKHPDWYREDLETLFGYLQTGTIHPIVDRTLPLSEAAQAFRLLLEKRVIGKIVLVPDGATAVTGSPTHSPPLPKSTATE